MPVVASRRPSGAWCAPAQRDAAVPAHTRSVKLVLRLATRHDALPIARMSRDLIERGLGWSWTPLRVARSIAAADTNVIVAASPVVATPLGFGIMRYGDEEAHLLLLAVDPVVRRHGVGAALVAWLEASARAAGVGPVYLEARAGNAEARAFYRRLGYGEIQRLAGYYGGVEASVRMAKDLWHVPASSA
jgi:ribosomal-protein-alanine N-acetyltransferase